MCIEYIEACSYDLFCPRYFNDHLSHQGPGAHKCNFNNVARVTAGKHGDVGLSPGRMRQKLPAFLGFRCASVAI